MGMNFAHLHTHSEHSLLDGVGKPETYAKYAKELGFDYLGVTDHGNVDGLIKWQKACNNEGIKPVLGCEGYIVPDASKKVKGEKRYHITVLVKNEKGWVNLLKMLSFANLEGHYYRPRFDFNLFKENCDGLMVLTGCHNTFLNCNEGVEFLRNLREVTDVYLEVMPHSTGDQKAVNRLCLDLHHDLMIPIVATNDCHYVTKDMAKAQEVLLAIQRKAKWNDGDRWRFDIEGLHLRTVDEMRSAFRQQGILKYAEIKYAMDQTLEIAEECSQFRIEQRTVLLPEPKIDFGDKNEFEFFRYLCEKEFKRKIIKEKSKYWDRYQEELELIDRLGFIRYFLIVWELIDYAEKMDVMTGPGRGSVGGSLIAYLLGITMVDPLKYGLVFSRFISPNRNDLPDIDLDFEDKRGDLILRHLEENYGINNVAGVSTFSKMNAKMVLRDLGRVFELPNTDVDLAAKAISKDEDLSDAFENNEIVSKFKDKHPEIADLALKLEGQFRSAGQHPAGMVVSRDDLREGFRANLSKRSNTFVVNWDKDDAEFMGMMKLDILRLNTLTVLKETLRLIKERTGEDIDLENIPLDDPKVYEQFKLGNTVGCFQVSTGGMVGFLRELEVDNFDLLVAANALYRPGTLHSGMAKEFIARKKGKRWKSIHPKIDEFTGETYGIVVYQEQVMRAMVSLAGMSWSEADKIRKIVGKSKGTAEFLKFEKDFVKGCEKQGTLDEKSAKKFWEMLSNFGKYGFNKSHSVEYSLISVWNMWLKIYYPKEFICANLTYIGNPDKKDVIVREASRLGLKIVLPKVGISDAKKWTIKDERLFVPFIEIKGVGEKTALSISKKRKSQSKGFFSGGNDAAVLVNKSNKMEETLSRIGVYDIDKEFTDDELKEVDNYFSFRIPRSNPYKNLAFLLNSVGFKRSRMGENILRGEVELPVGLKRRIRYRPNSALLDCHDCELREECRAPVLPSPGRYNIAIFGEAPGPDEDKDGEGFVGRAGVKLWKELGYYSLMRGYFHVSNFCKCYPSKTRTPTKKHINACFKWAEEEILTVKPFIILAFGNTGVFFFKGQTSGISGLSGKTEWDDKWGAWICWCLHPAAVLHQPGNLELFEEGIRNFSNKLGALGNF